jgi:hypothetical protein
MKFLSRNERDFLVCSDCAYYQFIEQIDPRYPLTRGRCTLFDKIVDDRWETTCPECTGNNICYDCIFCEYDEDGDEFCSFTGHYLNPDEIGGCSEFKRS